MFSTITRLFGKSPFHPLQSHMKNVSQCMKKLTEIFNNLKKRGPGELAQLVKELSKLEYEADLTKNDIRNHLPKSLFLPIDRGQFLDILAIQDKISDKAEDIGNLLILYPQEELDHVFILLQEFFEVNLGVFWGARDIIKGLHELLESSFGGIEAEKVKAAVERISRKEYEADKMKHELMKGFFKSDQQMSAPIFYLYIQLIEEISRVAHISEKLANRIRMILETK